MKNKDNEKRNKYTFSDRQHAITPTFEQHSAWAKNVDDSNIGVRTADAGLFNDNWVKFIRDPLTKLFTCCIINKSNTDADRIEELVSS